MKVTQYIGEQSFEIDYMPLGEHRDITAIQEDITRITDVSGVPLVSDRSDPPEGIDFEYRPCPYTESLTRYPNGSPSKVPMSGLEHRRLGQTFPRIRRLLLATRAAYLDVADLSPDHSMSTLDATNVLCAMQAFPTYLTERAVGAVARQGALPEFVVVGSNAAAGAMGAVGAYSRGVSNHRKKLAEGEVVLDAAEREPAGGLVGPKTVCVASPTMIKQFLNILKDGSEVISFGSIEEESDGLLEMKEFGSVWSFGLHLETTLVYNGLLANADHRLFQLVSKYNPKKHNSRDMRPILAEAKRLKLVIEAFADAYVGLSKGANMGLNRVGDGPGERKRTISHELPRIRSLKEARAKKIELDMSFR